MKNTLDGTKKKDKKKAMVFRIASWVMATYVACGQQLLKDLSGDECLSVIAADLRYESLSAVMVLRRRDTEEEQTTSSQKYTHFLIKMHCFLLV